MGEFPSGQRGQTVNLLAMPSMVRIHLPPPKIPIARLGGRYFSLCGRWSRSLSPSGEIHLPPPKIPITLLGDWYFSLRGRWSRSLSPSGEIHLPPPKIPIVLLGGRYFYAFSRRERSGHALPSPRGEGAERSEADEVERSRPPPVPPVVPPHPTTPHPSRRTAAPPSPQGEGLQAPLWLHRCSDALGEAVYTPPHTPGAPSRAASSRRDRPLTSVSKQSAHTVSPPRTHGHRYASAHDGSGAKHTSHRRIRVPPFFRKIIMHLDNFLHQFILVRIICQAVFLRLHKNRARLFLHARRVLLF